MTITPEHRSRLKALHARDPNFGVIGHLWAERVIGYMMDVDAQSMLDYGAGRSNLAGVVSTRGCESGRLPPDCHFENYEPAFGDRHPQPADFVTCIDVLEHVERLMLESVLLDIRRCMLKGGLITVSLRNAKKNSTTHPIVETREFWHDKLKLYFSHSFNIEEVPILDPTKAKSEVAFLMRKI